MNLRNRLAVQHRVMPRPLRAGFGALIALVVVVVTAAPSTAHSHSAPDRWRSYYLALGDSISYGFQLQKALAGLPPSAFDTGFVDVFGARLRRERPRLVTVNYSCPGESTSSMRTPCIWKASGHALHDDYVGPQLDAAIRFLRAHRGKVSPITLSLNGNDITGFVQSCPPGDLACVQQGAPAAIAAYQQRLRNIVSQLRKAAPDAQIILTGSYDENVGAFAFVDPLIVAVNAAESEVAARAHAEFADPFPVFNPQGDDADETAAICSLTLICTQQDSHPSDLGYRALADIVWATAHGRHQHRRNTPSMR